MTTRLSSPKFLRQMHGYLTLFWVAALFVTVGWWRDSILWVALMSVWANIAGHWSAWQAVNAEIQTKDLAESVQEVSK